MMKLRVLKLLRHKMVGQAPIYLSANFIKVGLGFIILPILSHLLAPAQYGLWAIWTTTKSLFERICGVGQNSLTAKSFHKEQVESFNTSLMTSFLIITAASMLCLLIMLPLIFIYPVILGIESEYYLLIPVVIIGGNMLSINTTLLRHEGRAWHFFSFEIVGALATPLLSIFCIMVLGMAWQGVLLGSIAGAFILWVWALVRIYKKYKLKFICDLSKLKSQISLGAPLIVHGMTVMVLTSSDRLILAHLMDPEAVGIYTINYKIGMTIQLFTLAFAGTIVPWVYKQLKQPSLRRRLNMVYLNLAYTAGMIVLALFIAVAGPWALSMFFDVSYHQHQEVIGWAAFGGLSHALYSLFICTLIFFDKNKIVMSSSMVVAAINIILTVIMIHMYGVVGAAIASFIAYTSACLIIFYYAERVFPLPWLIGIKRACNFKRL